MTRRPRVAYLSPLPPQRSGIADYSAELLPPLAAHVDVEPLNGEGSDVAAALQRCDVALYHLGNNRDFHAGIYRHLLAHPLVKPAVLMLHDYVVHHLVRDVTLHAGDADGYVDVMRWCYGRTGEAMARRAVANGVPLDPFRYPLFERAVDAAGAVIVHNRTTAARVLASRPETRIVVVPHHLALDALPATSPAEARDRLGIPAAAFVVATFGFLTEAKRLPVLLRSFQRLRRETPVGAQARLLLVGEVSPHYDFARIATGELRDGVAVTGRLDLARFLLHMAACDVAVNLRHPTAGETSGTLIRLLGLGKPVVVSRTGAFAEIPDGCCAKVDLDEGEEELLFATLALLAGDPGLRRAMGEAARRHVAAHTPEASAAAYAEVLRRAVAERWTAPPAPPPLAAYPAHDLFAELVRATSTQLADLGAGDDGEALDAVARAMVDLDLDVAGRASAR